MAIEIAPGRLKPIVHLRGRSYFVRVGGQLAFSLVRVTSVAQKCPVERYIVKITSKREEYTTC